VDEYLWMDVSDNNTTDVSDDDMKDVDDGNTINVRRQCNRRNATNTTLHIAHEL
jgi:transcriptional regulator NrdR family protein